jgi:hypothetical protein
MRGRRRQRRRRKEEETEEESLLEKSKNLSLLTRYTRERKRP